MGIRLYRRWGVGTAVFIVVRFLWRNADSDDIMETMNGNVFDIETDWGRMV